MVPPTLKHLALVACLLLPASGALAVDPVPTHQIAVDTSGNPTTTLNLGGTHITGTLDAARLGGSPTFVGLTVNEGATFNGSVLVPSAIATDNSQKAASTAFVQQLLGGALAPASVTTSGSVTAGTGLNIVMGTLALAGHDVLAVGSGDGGQTYLKSSGVGPINFEVPGGVQNVGYVDNTGTWTLPNLAISGTITGHAVGTAAGTVAAGNDSRLVKTYTPEMFADTTADDTTAVQAALTAACANAPARLLLSRMYLTSATVTGTKAITVEGADGACGLTSSVPTGDILAFIPTVAPTQSNPAGAIKGLRVRDIYLEASVAKTAGAALHVQYSEDARIERVKIGTFQTIPTGTPPNPYNGIFAEFQDNCVVLTPNICTSHEGITFCGLGASGSNGGAFAFGGYIGGSGKMYGTYTTGQHRHPPCGRQRRRRSRRP